MTDTDAKFFRAGCSDDSPISDCVFRFMIPSFECPVCGSDTASTNFGYPHLDPTAVLEQAEIEIIDAKNPKPAPVEKVIDCIERMKDRWQVPITAGTTFGPVRIAVRRRVKADFDLLPLHSGFFVRRRAAEGLRQEGFDFDYIDADATGKHAEEADYVQLIVPVLGRAALPEGFTFCLHCLRHSPPKSWNPALYETPELKGVPLFMILERGMIILRREFLAAAIKLGATGLIPGGTIFPVNVADGPAPRRPQLHWIRPLPVHHGRAPSPPEARGEPQAAPQPAPVLDASFAEAWTSRLREFLKAASAKGAQTAFSCGVPGKPVPGPAAAMPQSLRVLLGAVGSKLSFRYRLEANGMKFAGYLDLDASRFKRHAADCRKWAKETWIAEDPEEKDCWLKAFPFAALANGDYLGLADWRAQPHPPVIYLSHDDASAVIAPNLASFLGVWADLCFVGPEIWVLGDFLDKQSGFLRADTTAAREVRKVFGLS